MPDDDNKFGRKLKQIRTERNMSQEELAKLLGTSKQVICHYETGKRSPKVTTAFEYAQKLGVGLEELSGRPFVERDVNADRLEALHQNPRLGLLFDKSAKMSNEDVEFMLQMADRILKERGT